MDSVAKIHYIIAGLFSLHTLVKQKHVIQGYFLFKFNCN